MSEETGNNQQLTEPKKRDPKSRRAGQKVRKVDKKFLLRMYLGRGGNGKCLYHNETFHGTSKQADERLM